MRILAAFALLLVGASPETPPDLSYGGLTIPSPFRASFEVVPKVECVNARGSGVRVSDDVVITARHVVEQRGPCGIEGVPAQIAYHEPGKDFTALRVPLGYGYRAIISCDGIRPGETYYALGYANGGKPNVEPLIGTNQRDGNMMMLRGKVYKGMSGGGIFTSEGAFVAIINMLHREADWAYVQPLSETYLCRGEA